MKQDGACAMSKRRFAEAGLQKTNFKFSASLRKAWQATLDLGVVSSKPTLHVEVTNNKVKLKCSIFLLMGI